MELVKNIFFNTDKLIENDTVKISYTGKLFQEGTDEIYIHFGFGENWDNLSEIKMNKTELGFQAEINLISSEKLNLCFRSNSNEWDNNFGANYSFNVEPVNVALITVAQPSLIYPKKLRRSYILGKKVKLAIYKMMRYLPKIISKNYFSKKINESN